MCLPGIYFPKHLMDVYFLCLEPTYPCRLFPLPFVHSRAIRNRPIALSRAERADEVSIDLILWKHTDKGPLKPVLVQSPFFPNKVSMKREAEKHNYSSYWLISFFPRAKGLSPLWDKTQNEKKGGGALNGQPRYQGKPRVLKTEDD